MADKAKKARQIATQIEFMNRSLEWKKEYLTTASKAALTLRLQDIVNAYNSFVKTQDAYELLLSEEEYAADESRTVIENIYYNIRPEIESRIEELIIPETKNLESSCLRSFPKLPDITLPIFSGNLLHWSDFFEAFKSLVHSNKNLSDVVKFQYLKNSLKEAALSTISSLDFTAENYSKAIDLLLERYDNEKYICEEHIRSLFNYKVVDKASSKKLLEMVDNFKSHLRSLTTMKRATAGWDDLIVFLFVSKLDSETRSKWLDAAPPKKLPTFQELLTFITSHCHKLDVQPQAVQAAQKPSCSNSSVHHFKSNRVNVSHRVPSNSFLSGAAEKYFCILCNKSGHSILRCHQFLSIHISERWNKAKDHQLCYNCLKRGHMTTECPDPTSCRVCFRRHHTLLHTNNQLTSSITPTSPTATTSSPQSKSTSSPQSKSTSSPQSKSTSSSTSWHQDSVTKNTTLFSTSKNYIFLATAIIKVLGRNGEAVLARALLDSGSQTSFITEVLFKRLGLKFKKSNAIVCGIGGSTVTSDVCGTVTILSTTSDYCATIDVQVLPRITQPQPVISVDIQKWKLPSNIKLADDKFNKPQHIDVLLGAEIFCNLLSNGQIHLADDLPILQNTVFGWVVSGSFTSISTESNTFLSCMSASIDLENKIESFWKIETVDTEFMRSSPEEQACEEHFVQNTTRNKDGKFVVRLPFKESPSVLGNSFSMAQRRFIKLERRLDRNPQLRKEYCDFINEYQELGHMTPLSAEEVPLQNYIFPHHCVLKPDSSTTKLRVVFDGSAKSTSGKSLNEILMVGPTVQNDLFTILLRFRTHPYVFSADISKMYRQIDVHPEDTNYQLILWRDNPSCELRVFRLNTVTYGTTTAPFLATRCLKELANILQISYPLGSAVVKNDTYVDDILTGATSIKKLIAVKSETINLLRSAGMKLRKWYSNTSEILQNVPNQDQETLLQLDEGDFVKTLGVYWQPFNDEFHIKINVSQNSMITKRSVISDIARVFDPLGLSAPVITMGKLFMQHLWKLKLGWDDQLPSELFNQWMQFRNDLPNLKFFHISRYLFKFNSPSNIELHGFADASEKAYGAVIYTRCCLPNKKFYTALLCGKSRVAPLNKISLPRLELCAAQLLAQLMTKTKASLNIEISNTYYWSDSTIVLHWIRAPSSTWKTFVANRVSIIQELTDTSAWRHVDSKSNPADIISRGLYPTQLLQSEIWVHGPTFLAASTIGWPKTMIFESSNTLPDRKKDICLVSSSSESVDFIKSIKFYKSYEQLQGVIAFVLRFIANARLRGSDIKLRKFGVLSTSEKESSLLTIIRIVQNEQFHDEIQLLQKGKPIVKNPLKSLSVFMDPDGILRVGGRLQQSTLPYTIKHPILLPKNHCFTLTVLRFYHFRYLHAGPQALLAATRERFWPINGRRLASEVYRKCIVCFKVNPKVQPQKLGNLPARRIQPSPPFDTTGIDFCGPFYIHFKARGRVPAKAYVCVFICFAVKAIHIELVGDLTTASFLGALKRFVSTRGLCRFIYSDNGTNFVGANSTLNELYKLFQANDHMHQLHGWCSDNLVTWRFAPPGSPHFGGIYESAVKSTKFHLRRIVGEAHLTYEELLTTLKQIEAVLNSRPLVPLSSNPDDYRVLTPGDFLIGRSLMSLPQRDYTNQKLSLLKRWELVDALVQHFWIRWSKEYVTSLQHRRKWSTESTNLRIGQLVIMKDENLPPCKWLLGRIVELHPGIDNKVRVASITTSKGKFKRAIMKLCPLPNDEEDNVDG